MIILDIIKNNIAKESAEKLAIDDILDIVDSDNKIIKVKYNKGYLYGLESKHNVVFMSKMGTAIVINKNDSFYKELYKHALVEDAKIQQGQEEKHIEGVCIKRAIDKKLYKVGQMIKVVDNDRVPEITKVGFIDTLNDDNMTIVYYDTQRKGITSKVIHIGNIVNGKYSIKVLNIDEDKR